MVSGCLPSSCGKVEPRDLAPSDSLSRQLALSFVPDTLVKLWSSSENLAFPRTVQFAGENLFVADVRNSNVVSFNQSGNYQNSIAGEGWKFPYLAGGDTHAPFVYLPTLNRLDRIAGDTVEKVLDLPTTDNALTYAFGSGERIALKTLPKDGGGSILLYSTTSVEVLEFELSAPQWTHAGGIIVDADTVFSLRGFDRSIDVFFGEQPPQLRPLVGFDSPMLARAYSFRQGITSKPPLLSASAAFVDNRFFVMNMRPGWLRIDVYSRSGLLEALLVQPDPAFSKSFYPTDLDVIVMDDGYLIAVCYKEPTPQVTLFQWRPQ